MQKPLKCVIMIIAVVFHITACSDNGTTARDAEIDAWVEDGEPPDTEVPDGEPADARPPDAEIDPTWCQDPDNPLVFPGTDPNAVKIPGTGEGKYPSVSWTENHVAFSEHNSSNLSVVHLFDLNEWQEIYTTDPEWNASSVALFENDLVWSDGRNSTTEQFLADLFHYDIITGVETRWTNRVETNEFPVVLKKNHLLIDVRPVGGSGIATYLIERSTWDSTHIATSEVGLGAEGFDMSDKYISWVAHPYYMAPYRHVYYYNMETGETSFVETTGPGLGYTTIVDGERIVWDDRRNGNWDIYMYDIQTGEETQLTSDPYDQMGPRITGNLVVFRDYRYTKGHYGGCFCHLSILDVSTMILRKITTNPLFWGPGARRIIDGKLLATQLEDYRVYSLWLFDLVEMGILDPTGQHVLPEE